jgi:hypothetical protein
MGLAHFKVVNERDCACACHAEHAKIAVDSEPVVFKAKDVFRHS